MAPAARAPAPGTQDHLGGGSHGLRSRRHRAGRVVPIATSGASILSSTVRAAGCVIVPREWEGMPEGAEVEVRLYDDAAAEDSSP